MLNYENLNWLKLLYVVTLEAMTSPLSTILTCASNLYDFEFWEVKQFWKKTTCPEKMKYQMFRHFTRARHQSSTNLTAEANSLNPKNRIYTHERSVFSKETENSLLLRYLLAFLCGRLHKEHSYNRSLPLARLFPECLSHLFKLVHWAAIRDLCLQFLQ